MGELFEENGSKRPAREYKKDCLFCSYSAKPPRHLIEENKHAFSVVYGMHEKGLVLSKAQVLVISKEHRENFSELTKEEWEAHFPLIKNVIRRINKVYHPVGFDVFSSLNKEGGQSHFHSHIHIIPKYKKNYGYCRSKWDLSLNLQEHQEVDKNLQTEQGIIKENNKAVAELAPFGKQAGKGHIIIRPKNPVPNDIEKIDKETWAEMWELMKESVKRCKENLDAKGFWWHTPLGQNTDVDETTRSEFQIDIMPRWHVPSEKDKRSRKARTVPENERIAEKLRGDRVISNLSLYELIKQKSQELGRPLKIVADWDEVIQPLKPMAMYELYKLPKFSKLEKKPFPEFFKRIWEIAVIRGSFSSDAAIEGIEGTEEEQEMFNEYVRFRNLRRGDLSDYEKSFYSSPEWIKTITNAPYLSPAKDLLQALKEDLIKRLIIISSYRKGRGQGQGVTRKKQNYPKTFGKFPQCELELTEVAKDEKGKYVPYRWQRMRQIMPDWDIFIDDNPNIVNETIKNIPDKNKIYILPDYKNCRKVQGPNVYHVKTTVSDLTNEDFTKAAEEYKAKKEPKSFSQMRSRKIIGSWIIGGALVGIGIIVLMFYFWNKKHR